MIHDYLNLTLLYDDKWKHAQGREVLTEENQETSTVVLQGEARMYAAGDDHPYEY